MIKQISIQELQVGMYLVKAGNGSFSNPIEYFNRLILSEDDVSQLKASIQGTVVIDTGRSTFCPHQPLSIAPVPEQETTDKTDFNFEAVKSLYADSVSRMKVLLKVVRRESTVDLEKAARVVDLVAQLAMFTPSFLKRVMRLKQYDDYTYTHCTNVCALSVMFGASLGIDKDGIHSLGLGALLHDVGKMRIHEAILNKPGKLTDEEFKIMQQHPALGYSLLHGKVGKFEDVPRIALEHHERFDGKGYPQGLSGDKISHAASMVAICDVYDAITSTRVYQKARDPHAAIKILYSMGMTHYPPGLVEHFIRCMGVYPEGTCVQLASGQTAVVVSNNPTSPSSPRIKIITNKSRQCCRPIEVDLSAPHSVDGLEIAKIVQPSKMAMAALSQG